MSKKIQQYRGLEEDLPILEEGQIGFTTDTKKSFIGSDTGNVELANKNQITKDLNDLAINVKLFDAVGDGKADDTTAIQSAINYANLNNRIVLIPKGNYLISSPITLDGCSLIGHQGNIFNSMGTCIVAKTKNFTAIKQGSISSKDTQFSLSDIYVKSAMIGFEINYVINSKFERLYSEDCDTGYKLGDASLVGSMFNEFNNLYTKNCRVGIESVSKEYFNNNRFNNGYIYGEEYAMNLEVKGGYGAVNNTFNNVEFRSPLGRGAILTSAPNTVFNTCYFETGGNSIRAKNFSDIYLDKCVFGMFKAINTNADKSFVYADGGFRMSVNGGRVFVTSENENTTFYDSTNIATLANVYMYTPLYILGTATGFDKFKGAIKEASYKVEKQALTTSTLNLEPDASGVVDFKFTTPFSKAPDYYSITMRGASGQESNVHWALVSINATGGQLSVRNNGTGNRSVNFRVCAEVL